MERVTWQASAKGSVGTGKTRDTSSMATPLGEFLGGRQGIRYKAKILSLQGNHERDAQEEMRAAEAAGKFVYQAPEGEDQEFVDAPQQLEAQGDELLLCD